MNPTIFSIYALNFLMKVILMASVIMATVFMASVLWQIYLAPNRKILSE